MKMRSIKDLQTRSTAEARHLEPNSYDEEPIAIETAGATNVIMNYKNACQDLIKLQNAIKRFF
jgi:hypothetical protein